MEQKVQVLVDNVADSARAVLDFVADDDNNNNIQGVHRSEVAETATATAATEALGGTMPLPAGGAVGATAALDTNTNTPAATEAGRALSKDVGQLRRLVQAAITALRNAEVEDERRTRDAEALAAQARVAAGETGGDFVRQSLSERRPGGGGGGVLKVGGAGGAILAEERTRGGGKGGENEGGEGGTARQDGNATVTSVISGASNLAINMPASAAAVAIGAPVDPRVGNAAVVSSSSSRPSPDAVVRFDEEGEVGGGGGKGIAAGQGKPFGRGILDEYHHGVSDSEKDGSSIDGGDAG